MGRRPEQVFGLVAAFIELCNQIRSHGVWFGKRAVVGAVRVFESYLGATFLFSCCLHPTQPLARHPLNPQFHTRPKRRAMISRVLLLLLVETRTRRSAN